LDKLLTVVLRGQIIILTVLYGCETWSVTLTVRRTLKASENRVLRRIFGPKRGELVGGWRRLHNEELRNLYTSRNVIRLIKSGRIIGAGHVACMCPKT